MNAENLVSPGTSLPIGPEATLLGPDHPDLALAAEIGTTAGLLNEDVDTVRAALLRHPDSSLGWGLLARHHLGVSDPDPAALLSGYAAARVGYHRGLDALRRAGWRGAGAVPVTHPANRGFLLCLVTLGEAAALIGEAAEADRIAEFVQQCDPAAPDALAAGVPAAGFASPTTSATTSSTL